MARRVLHPIFDCPCMHLLSQLTKVGRTAGGVTSLESSGVGTVAAVAALAATLFRP